MDTKWTPNNGSNSDNPNHLPGTGHRHNGPQSTDSAVKEETEKQSNPISDRLDSGRGNTTNSSVEHSDSTMSNPVNDKVDTSEKSSDSADDNSPFDLSYFEGIYKTKEKDDPLDLSYFESPYDKTKLEEYLRSNVESGNQLAYTNEDLTSATQGLQNARGAFNDALRENALLTVPGVASVLNPSDFNAERLMNRDLQNNAYGNSTSKEEIKQKIIEKYPMDIPTISDNLLNAWAESAVAYNKEKQIREDLGRNGPTANSGITKAEELDLMNRAASDYSSLSDAEKEMANKVVEYAAAHPNALNQPPEPELPFETPRDRRAREERNRAREESNQRLRENVSAVNEAREAERREAERARETPATPTRTTSETPTSTSVPATDEPTRTEPTRTESVPETPATSSTPETPATSETPTSTSTPSETSSTESETPGETPAEETTPETPTTETPTESEDEIPEEIEEPSEETHSVMDAIEGLDDSRRWWEFGSEDYERTRHQIARISPTAEEEFMDFADLINGIVNGSAGDKVKAVLKLISKAAFDTFNILPKVCVDVAKDIVYRLIKGDYDTSGLTEGEQKQVQRFSHNRQNVAMMNSMLNTMDKPINSSIRGKGRGQATDEADYNEGMTEDTNDVVSDVTKKYIINHPWVFKAIQRW